VRDPAGDRRDDEGENHRAYGGVANVGRHSR
jgi:hypothetical protein